MDVSRSAQIFRVPPIISGTGKATGFKFCTNIHRVIGTKAHKNVGNSSDGRSQEVQKISGHPCIGRMGALRGHLCDSPAFLLLYTFTSVDYCCSLGYVLLVGLLE